MCLFVGLNEAEDIGIELIATMGRRSLVELEAVAGEAELLHHHGFADAFGHTGMKVDVRLCLALSHRQILADGAVGNPLPVERPEVEVQVIDILVRMNALTHSHIALATPFSFAARSDHVVRVKRLNLCGHIKHPLLEGWEVPLAEGTRLVANLPGEECRVLGILKAGVAVGSGDDMLDVAFEHGLGTIVLGILLHTLPIGIPAIDSRYGSLACPCPLEIDGVAARPFPRVVHVEHSHHIAFAQLGHQVVKPVENGVIIHAWCNLQRGLDLCRNTPFAIGSHEDAQVIDADTLHIIQFTSQTCTVASLSCGAKDGTVPEIGADKVVGLSVADKLPILHVNEGRCLRLRRFAGCQHQQA